MLNKKILLCLLLLICVFKSYSQQQTLDSLRYAYSKQISDTDKFRTTWDIVNYYLDVRTDSALYYADQNLTLAKKIDSLKFESASYKQIGDAFRALGDYPNALIFYLKRLEMDEKENNPYKKAISLNSIGAVYEYENDYERSLNYMQKAERIIDSNDIDELKSMIYVNLCDVYEKTDNLSNAFLYGRKSLQQAQKLNDTLNIGMSYNNLANAFAKNNQIDSALKYYKRGLPFLEKTNTYHTICESYNGMSELMKKTNNIDSAIYYAKASATLAQKMKLNNYYLKSCNLLSQEFAVTNRFDSAYYYQSEAMLLKDSVFNDEKAKQLQLLTMKEEIRQKDIAEAAAKEKENFNRKLQLLAIGLLIPVFFFITILLSKRKVKTRVVEFTGILSLLILFEYITLLIHPAIENFTNGTPIYEIVIFIIIAAILTPAHHHTERWLIDKLTIQNKGTIKINTKKIHQKRPE